MRILILHNRYLYRGGEDESTESEVTLLRERGHQVQTLTLDNHAIAGMNRWRAALSAVWSTPSYRTLRRLLGEFRPQVVSVHNFFPLLSPSIYFAAEADRVPVVQALHNYRLLCPGAMFFRNRAVCEACTGRLVPWPGMVYGCYRGSRAATAAVTAMIIAHRAAGTWHEKVRAYITPTEFARKKFEEAGFPLRKLVVKPNFLLRDPGLGSARGGFGLFVGRFAPEKGIETLLAAWQKLRAPVGLKLVGDGPMMGEILEAADGLPTVEVLGPKSLVEVYKLMGEAAFLVFPSEWYETFGRVAVEAFAKGTPVIASDIGAISELVSDGRTGLLFRPGDPEDLAAKVEWFLSHPAEAQQMRAEARDEFLAKYTAERNYRSLMDIFERAIDGRGIAVEPRAAAARAAGQAG
jgi:glycosyltransferase involved in cell wall biosynthesis